MNPFAQMFKVLGDPIRLRLMNLMAQRGPGICVCDLVDVLQLPQSTISRQIAPLRTLGLIRARRAGTWMLYGLEEAGSAFQEAIRPCLDVAAEESAELKADLERFDLLRERRELASCCRPELLAARNADSACCGPSRDGSLSSGNTA